MRKFVKLAEKEYYDGIIHLIRIYDSGRRPPATCRAVYLGKPFEDECDSNVSFDKVGLLAMANAGPGTNGSQFFITTTLTPWLHMHHTIFGEVVEGYDVVQKIENCETGFMDKPVKEQKILSVEVSDK